MTSPPKGIHKVTYPNQLSSYNRTPSEQPIIPFSSHHADLFPSPNASYHQNTTLPATTTLSTYSPQQNNTTNLQSKVASDCQPLPNPDPPLLKVVLDIRPTASINLPCTTPNDSCMLPNSSPSNIPLFCELSHLINTLTKTFALHSQNPSTNPNLSTNTPVSQSGNLKYEQQPTQQHLLQSTPDSTLDTPNISNPHHHEQHPSRPSNITRCTKPSSTHHHASHPVSLARDLIHGHGQSPTSDGLQGGSLKRSVRSLSTNTLPLVGPHTDMAQSSSSHIKQLFMGTLLDQPNELDLPIQHENTNTATNSYQLRNRHIYINPPRKHQTSYNWFTIHPPPPNPLISDLHAFPAIQKFSLPLSGLSLSMKET